MRRPFLHALAATAAGWSLAAMTLSGHASADALRQAGERLYQRGVSASGQPIDAIVQGDLRVRSTDMPCVNCHRRSGWGTAEGPVTVPAVAAPVLFAPVTQGAPQLGPPRTSGAGTRPAYTDAALLRALRDGVDPFGRRLSPTMPRYELSGADAAALAGYLRTLGAEPPPGVDDSTLHLATVVAAGVDAGRRTSMLDVLRTYVRYKNGEMRHESRRRERGPWDMRQHYETYRTWVLHEWELQGAPATWPAQLAALYDRQPVFAIVGGLADDWSPIHAFSEARRLPAVLPQAPIIGPAGADAGFYSMYFSPGLRLEARALARHLETSAPGIRVLQVFRCGAATEAVAASVAAAPALRSRVRSACLEPGTPVTADALARLAAQGDAALVLWLAASDLALATLPPSVESVYVSSSLLGEAGVRATRRWNTRTLLLHPSVAPDEFDEHAWRSLTWLKANGLTPSDRAVAVNALFASMLVSDALSHPRTLDSREYFLERLEHMAGRSPQRSAYPSITFDARRRVASLGCYVLEAPHTSEGPFRKVEPWFVPGP